MKVSWVRLWDNANQFFLSLVQVLRPIRLLGVAHQGICVLCVVQPSKNVSTWLVRPVYAENQTGRRECHDSAETLTTNWETLQSHVKSWNELTGVNIATTGLCFFRACCEKYKSLSRMMSVVLLQL